MNTILKLFLSTKQWHYVPKIWADILLWRDRRYDPDDYLSLELVMICCIKCRSITIQQCCTIIEWMQHCHTPLKLHGSSISQLISKCHDKHHHSSLQYIHSLLRTQFIINDSNIYIQTSLIGAYGRCQDLNASLNVFNSVSENDRNIVCINAMLKALVHNQLDEDALKIYHQSSSKHDHISHFLAIKACKNLRYWDKGRRIISSVGNLNSITIQFKTGLIDFYGSSNDMKSAISIFNDISDEDQDGFVIGTMIKQYAQNRYNVEAIELYDAIYASNPSILNNSCHLFAIKACTQIGDVWRGKEIHSKLEQQNENGKDSKEIDVQLKNALIHFYGHFKCIEPAQKLFDSILEDHRKRKWKVDSITFNSMIQALIRCGHYQRALAIYDTMTQKDGYSHSLALRACIHCKDTERGKLIHEKLTQQLDDDNMQSLKLKAALIDFYGFFDLTSAWNLFHSIPDSLRDGRCVGAMMKALISNQHHEDALLLYDRYESMQNATIQMLGIKACSNLGDHVHIEKGKAIHRSIDFENVTSNELDLKNTLIHFYGNAMDLETAKTVFDSLEDGMKDIVSINAMMDAFTVNDCNQEAIDLFRSIPVINKLIVPDVLSYKIVVNAVTFVASMESAIWIYNEIKEKMNDKLYGDRELQIKTMNMLSKYGMVDECKAIFEKGMESMHSKDGKKQIKEKMAEVWNAMIRAYCSNNQYERGYEMHQEMGEDMVNVSTFEILLNALSHSGRKEEALRIWCEEILDEQIKYDIKVINVMVDCFARTGYLQQAFDFIIDFESKSGKQSDVVWNTLMSGCAKYNDKEMGQRVYDEMQNRFKLESNSMTGAKVSLSNIYGSSHEFGIIREIRE